MGKAEESKPLVDTNLVERGTLIFRAIDHPLRLRILRIINKNNLTSVTKLYKQLKTEQSQVSSHLKILREAGLVRPQRKGRHVCYQVVEQRIEVVQQLSAQLLDYKMQQDIIPENPVRKVKVVKHHTFSQQEKIVIRLICEQYTNEEIAMRMGLSKRTVEGYRDQIIEKMQVKNTAGLVVYAIKAKLYKL